ncbi:hypothetical protein ACFCZR_24750 [Streptomyces rubiginosohelvolus]|uniref:hypothetical protein n=1 Tax=Streptomyces rubiginosohelvolus TaxID=67362 RepID=UPI0035D8322B
MELLALTVEEVALLAADRRREEPTTIIRPQLPGTGAPRSASEAPQPPQPEPELPAPRMTGHRQMLMVAMQRGMVRSG